MWFKVHSTDVLTFYIYLSAATAGEVINVFMAILIGSFSLAQLAPEMQAVTDACGAAAKLYETIDRIPDIDSSDPGGLKLEKVEYSMNAVKRSPKGMIFAPFETLVPGWRLTQISTARAI